MIFRETIYQHSGPKMFSCDDTAVYDSRNQTISRTPVRMLETREAYRAMQYDMFGHTGQGENDPDALQKEATKRAIRMAQERIFAMPIGEFVLENMIPFAFVPEDRGYELHVSFTIWPTNEDIDEWREICVTEKLANPGMSHLYPPIK